MSDPTGSLPAPSSLTNEQLLNEPIFIVGAPRSGTTLLAEVLKYHPDLAYVGEPRLIWKWGNDSRCDMLTPGDARPAIRKHIRARFAELLRQQHRCRLLEKSPDNSLRMDFINEIFPNGRYIHIIRNGIDASLSIYHYRTKSGQSLSGINWSERLRQVELRQVPHYVAEVFRRAIPKQFQPRGGSGLWGPRIPGMRGLQKDLDLIDVCALQWRMCVEAACMTGRQLPDDRYLEIRLEDSSLEMLDRIIKFANLKPSEKVKQEFISKFRTDEANPGARSKHADAAQIERIRRWTEPTMQWL